MTKTTSVLIVGVGGQGTLLASRILGEFAAEMGLECKLSEVHGMSQRGGSVVTHVRFGTEVNSPIVAEGDADYILAFEQLEAFRYRHFLKDEGTIIMNTQKIMPMPVILGTTPYPANIPDRLKGEGLNLVEIDALTIAEEIGNSRTVNTIILGCFMKMLKVEEETAVKILTAVVPQKVLEINLVAFKKGYDFIA